MQIIRDNKEIKLTPKELEAAYREREHQYLMQDATEQFHQHLEENSQVTNHDITDQDYEMMIQMFEKTKDCNVPENQTWENIMILMVQKNQKERT